MKLELIVGIELVLMGIAIIVKIRVSRAVKDMDGLMGTVKKRQLPGGGRRRS